MKDLQLWKRALTWLEQGERVILFIVVKVKGSSPGKVGFKMVVCSTGEFAGTVGGAVMEAELIKNAFSFPSPHYQHLVHSKNAPENIRSGLYCAGSQDIISIELKRKDAIQQIIDAYGSTPLVLIIQESGMKIVEGDEDHPDYKLIEGDKTWRYEELIAFPFQVVIFGGGHTGIAVSRQMKFLNFYVIVIDHREDLNMHKNNPWADKIYTGHFSDITSKIRWGRKTYVVICSPTIKTDILALKAVINYDVPYIGLMASKAKRNSILKSLRETESKYHNIRMPIGLNIADQTVEEIAVSIAAEIISVKNAARSKLPAYLPRSHKYKKNLK